MGLSHMSSSRVTWETYECCWGFRSFPTIHMSEVSGKGLLRITCQLLSYLVSSVFIVSSSIR